MASIPSRWRPAWVGWWVGTATAAAAAVGADFTAVGHVLALLLGLGLSCRLGAPARWTPTRLVLLAGGVVFGYLMLAGSLTMAPTAGLTAALIACLAAEVTRPFGPRVGGAVVSGPSRSASGASRSR
jgi:hypothetical protein